MTTISTAWTAPDTAIEADFSSHTVLLTLVEKYGTERLSIGLDWDLAEYLYRAIGLLLSERDRDKRALAAEYAE